MAKYVTDSEFKRLVRVCLDQNMSSEALAALDDVDTLSLDEIIDSKAEDAALTVVRIAPIDKLGDVAQSLEGALSIAGGEPHKGVIQLPLDFERLVRFKMLSWQYAVFTALPPLSPLYIEANSEFGVCGTKDRPLVFLVPSTENNRDLCLEIFSAKNTDDVLDGCLYVASPKKRVVGSDGGNTDERGNYYYYSGAIGHFDDDVIPDDGGDGDGGDDVIPDDGGDGDGGDDDGGDGGNDSSGSSGGYYYYYSPIGHWDDEIEEVSEYVDLGLPSGTLWATCNVGASSPEDSGEYFSWGETEPKDMYSWPDYKFGNYTSISKYNVSDGNEELDAEDDAATARVGSCWQIPTHSQLWELVSGQYTTVVWSERNGVGGHLITSKENGNSIFLPATGEISGTIIEGTGTYGKYWSRTLNFGSNTNINDACILQSHKTGCGMGHLQRCNGLCVRPVYVPSTPLGRKKKPRIDDSIIVERDEAGVSGTVASVGSWKMLLGERLLMPTVYYAAYLTALAVNDENAAEKLLVVAKSLMES